MAVNFTIYGGLVQLSGTRIEIKVTNDAITGESPRALLKATSTDGAVPGGPFEDSKPWTMTSDTAGYAVFDFSEYFDAPVDYDFTYPYGDAVAVKHALRAFDLDILAGASYIDDDEESETYGEKQETWQDAANAVSIRILKGGLSQHRQSVYAENESTFYADFIQGNKFLTYRPDKQKIAYAQPVRLWYLLPGTESVTYDLKVVYTAADGTETTLTYPVDLDPDGLYEFVLDPVKHGIPSDAQKFVVYLASGETLITEQRTFVIDSKDYEKNTFLFFTNSLGGIDDLWFTGAVKFSLSASGETGSVELDRSATQKDRSVMVTSSSGSRKWFVYPGNRLTEDDMDYLQDFIYSRQKWLVLNGYIIPVNLELDEFELTDSIADLVINEELEFELTEAHSNNYF